MSDAIKTSTTLINKREYFAEFEGKIVADIPALKKILTAARIVEDRRAKRLDEKQTELITAIATLNAQFAIENQTDIEDYKQAAENLDNADNELRSALIVWSQTTGEKTFDKQLSVRVTEKLEYKAELATIWARGNAAFTLTIDKKKFEAIAKDNSLSFVRKIPSYSAVIATDLTNREVNK